MSRYKAFGIHFGISLIIFLVLASLVLYAWYPGLFFETDGGWQGIRIIILVDLVLGPLLTLVVYKAGKPGLRMDLTCIGILQAVCLVAGTYVVYQERPLGLVFADGRFETVTAGTFEDRDMPVPDFSEYPGGYPKWILVELPEDPIAQSEIRRELRSEQMPTSLLVDRYVPFDPERRGFSQEPSRFEDISEYDDQQLGTNAFFEEFGGKPEEYLFFPYAARYQYYFLAFDRETRELVGSLKPFHLNLQKLLDS